MKEQIKEVRVKIDGLSQLTRELKPLTFLSSADNSRDYNSPEIEKAYDSLILAKAWLGKVLGELGEATPYTNDGNRKTVEDIEPTADKGHVMVFGDFNHIEKVDWLRQEIQYTTHLVTQTIHTGNQSREFAIARTNSYNHLCEARFWLGFELQRIKESKV